MCEGIIYRLRKAPEAPVKYTYLTVSDNVDEPAADLLMINDFRKVKERLKKRVKKGTGLEVTVTPVRKMDGAAAGKWFDSVSELYVFCHSFRCQFILSSGARSVYEMVSGPSLDAMLKTIGVEPQGHWQKMGEWLGAKLSKRVSYA
jgi:RNase P/RNase MRP subunit p30